jgi:hypothetical protein
MLIAFVHSGRSFMPEAEAYTNYFSSRNISCVVTTPEKINDIERDIEWFFLGADRTKLQKNIVRIHEYTSASTPPLSRLKDVVKKTISTKPDYRIFLNPFVQNSLRFNDDVPYGFREMGIPADWLETEQTIKEKKYDFIYTGDVSAQRKIHALLEPFTSGDLKKRTIVVISKNYEMLQKQFSSYPNIQFKGPLGHNQIRDQLLGSRYSLNFVPDIIPYNQQTSTKFLEYAANKIPIISTRYCWITEFQKKYGGNYFYLEPDLSNLNWEAITSFDFAFPDLSEWTWERQIGRSGVLDFLRRKFPGQNF